MGYRYCSPQEVIRIDSNDNVVRNTAAALGGNGGQGGGIYNAAFGTLTLVGGQIQHNSVGSAGGGIFSAGSFFTSEGAQTKDYSNSAEKGGGIAIVRNLPAATREDCHPHNDQ